MAKVNWGSIHKKVGTHIKNSSGVKQAAKKESMEWGRFFANNAARSFSKALYNEINSNPQIDIAGYDALRHISHEAPYISASTPNGYIFTVGINFDGDMHRESLAPDYYPEGIDNIAALINRGYHAAHTISGVWNGHPGRAFSLKDRHGANFAQNAVRAFSSSGSAKTNHVIDIRMNDIYK